MWHSPETVEPEDGLSSAHVLVGPSVCQPDNVCPGDCAFHISVPQPVAVCWMASGLFAKTNVLKLAILIPNYHFWHEIAEIYSIAYH